LFLPDVTMPAVELPEASVFRDTAELRGHDRDCAACRHEIFEELNRAHRSERIGQHHVDEVALVYHGRRFLVGLQMPALTKSTSMRRALRRSRKACTDAASTISTVSISR